MPPGPLCTPTDPLPLAPAQVKRGVRYVLVGGTPFWQRAEVQDVLAYLHLAVRGASCPDVITERVLNVPKRALGKVTVERLLAAARAQARERLCFCFRERLGRARRRAPRAHRGKASGRWEFGAGSAPSAAPGGTGS